MNSKEEINEYLRRLKNGEKCLDEFFYAVSGYVKFIAYKYLVDKSYESDVVMNTFCKIFDNIQSFDENQNGKAWICKIAQNEAFSINSRERKHTHAQFDEIIDDVACAVDESENSRFVVDLERALTKLDETDRIIIEQRVFGDKTFEEISDELGMYVGTVHKRFKRSIKKINNDIL